MRSRTSIVLLAGAAIAPIAAPAQAFAAPSTASAAPPAAASPPLAALGVIILLLGLAGQWLALHPRDRSR